MKPEEMTQEQLIERVRALETAERDALAALEAERQEHANTARQLDFVQRQRDAQVQRTVEAERRASAWEEHSDQLRAELERERSGLRAALKVTGGATAVVGGLHLLGALLDD